MQTMESNSVRTENSKSSNRPWKQSYVEVKGILRTYLHVSR